MERIRTQHPQGLNGVNIDKAKYDAMRSAILAALAGHGELTFTELGHAAGTRLPPGFAGSVSWYYTSVKLDLEAHCILLRVPGSKPQRIRLAPGASD